MTAGFLNSSSRKEPVMNFKSTALLPYVKKKVYQSLFAVAYNNKASVQS